MPEETILPLSIVNATPIIAHDVGNKFAAYIRRKNDFAAYSRRENEFAACRRKKGELST